MLKEKQLEKKETIVCTNPCKHTIRTNTPTQFPMYGWTVCRITSMNMQAHIEHRADREEFISF